MSDGAVSAALARLGCKGIITGHGFRHMALERQLSQKDSVVSGVYNKAKHLPERRKIMQEWAVYLDMLRSGGAATAGGMRA